ncbi:hypothetical protein BKA82DRAFT_4356307 [Pisolithus tinctorius]|nr:hypothetical protein BKA82DRAFT_4356307 [Pisolithus tinctorius]
MSTPPLSLLPPSSPPIYKSDDSTHPVGDIVHPCQEGGPIYTRLQKKGKGRAIDAKDIAAANHSDCDTQLPNLKKPGNLSTAVLDEICAFAKDVKTMAEELGQWHGWSTCNIVIAMGFSVKASHTKINEANLFCSCQSKFNQQFDYEGVQHLMIGIPKDDFVARREKLKAIYEWSESSSAIPTNRSVKSIAARVDNAKTQFSGLAEVWSNLKDIEIVGAVMYVGQNPAGCQTSGIFGGSETIRNFINENGIDVQSLMNKYTSVSGMATVWMPGWPALVPLEIVFGSMMKEKMLAALRDLHSKLFCVEVIDILDADPLKGEIMLVKATNGTVLQQISDDPEWQKSLKETDRQQQGMEVLRQPQP